MIRYSLITETSSGVSSRAVVAVTASVVPLAVITIVSLVLVVLLLVYMRHKQVLLFQKQKPYPMTEVSVVIENEGKDKTIDHEITKEF